MNNIVQQTNVYSTQKRDKSVNVGLNELGKFTESKIDENL